MYFPDFCLAEPFRTTVCTCHGWSIYCVTACMCSVYITALQPWKTHIFSLAVIIFSPCIFLDWSAIKTLASPLSYFPLLITIIVWTSVEFRCETFALVSRIKHAVSWPFVCSDFHSTGKQRSLETLRKMLFSLKNTSSRSPLLGLVSCLFFCSILGQHC